ncbi:MAG: hypothetical protein HY744_24100 [Deltaproteobacteria bacterium]|nr:hypothetical protein [Deltaproteobacteria bacterium]
MPDLAYAGVSGSPPGVPYSDFKIERYGLFVGLGGGYEYAPVSFLALGAAFEVLVGVEGRWGRPYIFLHEGSARIWAPLGRFEPFLLLRSGQALVHWADDFTSPYYPEGYSYTNLHPTMLGAAGLTVWADAAWSVGVLVGFRFSLAEGWGKLEMPIALHGALTAGYGF